MGRVAFSQHCTTITWQAQELQPREKKEKDTDRKPADTASHLPAFPWREGKMLGAGLGAARSDSSSGAELDQRAPARGRGVLSTNTQLSEAPLHSEDREPRSPCNIIKGSRLAYTSRRRLVPPTDEWRRRW